MPPSKLRISLPIEHIESNSYSESGTNDMEQKSMSLNSPSIASFASCSTIKENHCIPKKSKLDVDGTGANGTGANGMYYQCSRNNSNNTGLKITKPVDKKNKKAINDLINMVNDKGNVLDCLEKFIILPQKNTHKKCINNAGGVKDYYFTKHVPGRTLQQVYEEYEKNKSGSELTAKDLKGLRKQLYFVLSSLHHLGFYHNDIKSNNILVVKNDNDVHICDIVNHFNSSYSSSTYTKWMVKLIDFDLLTRDDQNASNSFSACKEQVEGAEECVNKLIPNSFDNSFY